MEKQRNENKQGRGKRGEINVAGEWELRECEEGRRRCLGTSSWRGRESLDGIGLNSTRPMTTRINGSHSQHNLTAKLTQCRTLMYCTKSDRFVFYFILQEVYVAFTSRHAPTAMIMQHSMTIELPQYCTQSGSSLGFSHLYIHHHHYNAVHAIHY